MSFILSHTRFGFCWWDLLALVALVAVVVVFVVRHKKMKERTEQLEDEISAIYAGETLAEEQEA